MGKQSRIIEVPNISCRRSVEAVKRIPHERDPERRCEQSEVIKVTETSSQNLDETGMSKSHVFVRGSVKREGKERNPLVFCSSLRKEALNLL